MESTPLLDRAGRRRSPATTSSFHQGVSPRNKGLRYPPDPPTVEEIVAVMRAAGDSPEGVRLRAIIVVLWRAGLRISEALALSETDLDPGRGSLVVRHGKGDKTAGGRDGPVGVDASPAVARAQAGAAGRSAVLRGARPDPGTAVRIGRHPGTTASHRGSGRSTAPVRAPPAPARARDRDVPGRDLAAGHPETARACRPSDHIPVPTRDRQHRDHCRSSRAACPDDPSRPPPAAPPLTHLRQTRQPKEANASGRAYQRGHPSSMAIPEPRSRSEPSQYPRQVAEGMARPAPVGSTKGLVPTARRPAPYWHERHNGGSVTVGLSGPLSYAQQLAS